MTVNHNVFGIRMNDLLWVKARLPAAVRETSPRSSSEGTLFEDERNERAAEIEPTLGKDAILCKPNNNHFLNFPAAGDSIQKKVTLVTLLLV